MWVVFWVALVPRTEPDNGVPSTRPPPAPFEASILHPTYSQACYRYLPNLTAENVCCKMKNYHHKVETLHQCIILANDELLAKQR